MIEPKEHDNERERLKDLESYNILNTLPESDYDGLTGIAAEICGTHISLVSLIDDKRQWFKSHHGLDAAETPKEYAFCAHAINDQDNVFIVEDARRDKRFHDNPLVTGEPFVIFYAGVPLVSENGLPLGTLCVIDDKPKLLSKSQIHSLKALAQQVMNLLTLRKKRLTLRNTLNDLEETKEKFEVAQQVAHLGHWELNLIENKLTWSDEIYRIFDLNPQEFEATYEAFLENIHPGDRDKVNEAYTNSLKTKEAYKIEHRLLLPSGELKYVIEGCTTEFNDKEEPILSIGTVLDITKQKQAELKLSKAKEKLEEAQRVANLGHWEFNIVENKLTWSDEVYRIFNFKPQEFEPTYEAYMERIHPEDRDKVNEAYTSSLKTKQKKSKIEHRLLFPTGEIKYVFEKGIAKYNDKGEPVSILGIILDITKQKRTELELLKTREILEEAQQIANVGNWEIDLTTNKSRWSKQTYVLLGLDPQTTVPSVELYMSCIHPDDAAFVKEKVDENFAYGTASEFGARLINQNNGKVINTMSRTDVEKDKDGNFKRLFGTVQDITKLKKIEEKLKELNASKDRLFSIIGHDLRGPIGSFKNLTELLISDFDFTDTKKLSNILKTVHRSATTTYDLLENLLLWARSQQNEITFSPVNCNLHEITGKSILLHQELANNKKINIINNTPKILTVFADVNMVRTVIRNLISNAIKFTNSDKSIYVSANKKENDILISVKDEGIGISSENIKKIFNSNENFTTFGTGNEKGSGLGLMLCQEFIKKHGGEIWIESELGKGSDFKFTLPLD